MSTYGNSKERKQMSDSLVIEREFAAPIELVWSMWAEAKHFASWYGPQGASIPVANMDVQVGGTRHFCMEVMTPNGPMKMWFVGEYKEITPHTRLVYTEAMSDEDGNAMDPAAMGMPEGTPTTTDVIVELSSVDAGTKMVMTHVGVAPESPGAMGWNMAIDKLGAYIESQ